MPCYELFEKQPESYRTALIPPGAKKVVIEAGHSRGWLDMVGGTRENTLLVCIDHFGGSAPAKVLAEKFGFTADSVVTELSKKFPEIR
jgi:transketolase